MAKPMSNSPEGLAKSIVSIQRSIRRIEKQLQDNERTSLLRFRFAVGFAAITLAAGVALASRSLGTDSAELRALSPLLAFGGLIIIVFALLQYRGNYHKCIAKAAFALMVMGTLMVTGTSLSNTFLESPMVLWVNLGGLFVLALGTFLVNFASRPVKIGTPRQNISPL